MKVKITKGSHKLDCWYNDRIGEIFEVTQDRKGNYEVTEKEYRKLLETEETKGVLGYHIQSKDCEVVTEIQWLNRATALKLAIDGAKVANEAWALCGSYVSFDGKNFRFGESNMIANGVLDYDGRWKLWTPTSPKFTNGTFVVDECGDYMRVIDSEFVDGRYKCYLASGKECTKEFCHKSWESELTEA